MWGGGKRGKELPDKTAEDMAQLKLILKQRQT